MRTFKKIVQWFIGDNLEFVPALYEKRVEKQYHDGFDNKVEEDQQGSIHLCGDSYGEAGHSAKNDIGRGHAQQRLQRVRKEEGTQQKCQKQQSKHDQPQNEYLPC